MKAGFDEGQGAVDPGMGRSGGFVGSLHVEGSGAVDLQECLFKVGEVPGPRFWAAGGQKDHTEKAEPTGHAMRSNPV